MHSFKLRPRSWLTGASVLGACVVVGLAVAGGCTIGGDEGDVCNPLVLQDECNSGLHCTQATCSTAYCCPTNRSSTAPNCNAQPGCPDGGDEDAAEEAGDDAASGASDASDASASTDASDASDAADD